MQAALLTTKLYRPRLRFNHVSRSRLIDELAHNLGHKLTLVSAPAGFGKTTLVSEWAEQSDLPTAWVSLDEGDNDPARFLTYVAASLQTIEPDVGEISGALLQSSQPLLVESILTALINEITNTQRRMVLILDDYHQINGPAIHDALTFLLDHQPQNLHLVIATRVDPPLPLAGLRVSGDLFELRAEALRFTPDEIAAFLHQAIDSELTSDEVIALEARTEGWIAGLQLAAVSMQGREDIHDFIAAFTGSHRYVLDYLTEEVLSQQSAQVQNFLLQTSILDQMNGALCEAVTGLQNGQDMLEWIDQANLFVVPLDDERRWYRYHHLFGNMLRRHLEKTNSSEIPDLHRRASAWFWQHDMLPQAIAHSLAAHDFDQAASLIEQIFDNLLGQAKSFTTILSWLEALPEEVIHTHPRVGILHGWILSLTEQLDAVEPRIQEVERAVEGELPDAVRFEVTVLRAYVARQKIDVDKAIELSLQALETYRENPASGSMQAYTGIAFNLALAYRTHGEISQAQQWYCEALRVSQEADSIIMIILALHGLACVQLIQGQLNQAEENLRLGLQLADEATQQSGKMVPPAARLHVSLAELLREQNRLAEAANHLAQGLELCRQWQMEAFLCRALIVQSRLKLAGGDMVGSLNLLQEAEEHSEVYQESMPFCIPVPGARALVILTQIVSAKEGNDLEALGEVAQWANTQGFNVDDSIDSVSSELEYLIWARLLIAQDEPGRALHLLKRMLPAAEDGERIERVIKIYILQALAYQALGDIEQALDALRVALSLGAPQRYVWLFIAEGPQMAELLQKAGAQGIQSSYVSQLLSAYSDYHELRQATSLVDPLSDRELEVLRMIAVGMTNPEIAEKLILSIGTVKSHTGNIYSKLGVHNRTEAVTRAMELNLL
jgi:LuxR family maltose regulon positive regulatory protein